ncbi:MAG: MFS transporter [Alphaproteobacteria bacterium]|nr:MFS transporter [Alphaproteobacteria bacterium]MBU0797543.1 MFS transporter [Alphaproteobacteria bacterium]MBU0885874.1 MFS transporter [Alphaproteobacteria bacterium]MBU1814626.1 MFS transporter [Alphaproteobacteria bacterium]
MPLAVYALTIGAFGIGVTEFVIMGLLLQVSADLNVSISDSGLLISGYALGVFVGAPVLTLLTRSLPRKTVLIALMAIFTIGNLACALAPTYGTLMAARVVTALAHGTFFGVGSIVATGLVAPDRRASAISIMFTGLTLATLLGVPFGAWLGLHYGWRSTFWAVTGIGVIAMIVLTFLVPRDRARPVLAPLSEELSVLRRPLVLIGLAMTVLGFGGVFAVFSYIQPILIEITGFSNEAVSPILLVFGGGLILGNLAGGKLADRRLLATLFGTLAALALVLLAMSLVLESPMLTVAFVGLLGAAAFATVAPLQLRLMEAAGGAGQTLASSLNIAAFNLGNALGAWLGGAVIDHGPGLASITWIAAAMPAAAIAVGLLGRAMERREAVRQPVRA